jgi:hypothetical protein
MDRQDAKSAKNGKKTIKPFLKHFCLKSYPSLANLASWRLMALFFFLLPFHVFAEEQWIFLPVKPLFRPLIGDPREPQTNVIAYTSQAQFEGAIGTTLELLRHSPSDETQWGWGVLGSGFILLGVEGVAFPLRANDWYAGMYLSESSGLFSHRLEFVHQSSHLGDSYEGSREPMIYNGENFNFTTSVQLSESLRLYAGIGAWENLYPNDKAFFASIGTEIYSPPVDFIGTFLRGYGTFHLKWKAQACGAFNKTAQFGIQWKFKKEESRALRLAMVYYNGFSEYGQFYQAPDEHWAVGVYFDP